MLKYFTDLVNVEANRVQIRAAALVQGNPDVNS